MSIFDSSMYPQALVIEKLEHFPMKSRKWAFKGIWRPDTNWKSTYIYLSGFFSIVDFKIITAVTSDARRIKATRIWPCIAKINFLSSIPRRFQKFNILSDFWFISFEKFSDFAIKVRSQWKLVNITNKTRWLRICSQILNICHGECTIFIRRTGTLQRLAWSSVEQPTFWNG